MATNRSVKISNLKQYKSKNSGSFKGGRVNKRKLVKPTHNSNPPLPPKSRKTLKRGKRQ